MLKIIIYIYIYIVRVILVFIFYITRCKPQSDSLENRTIICYGWRQATWRKVPSWRYVFRVCVCVNNSEHGNCYYCVCVINKQCWLTCQWYFLCRSVAERQWSFQWLLHNCPYNTWPKGEDFMEEVKKS